MVIPVNTKIICEGNLRGKEGREFWNLEQIRLIIIVGLALLGADALRSWGDPSEGGGKASGEMRGRVVLVLLLEGVPAADAA